MQSPLQAPLPLHTGSVAVTTCILISLVALATRLKSWDREKQIPTMAFSSDDMHRAGEQLWAERPAALPREGCPVDTCGSWPWAPGTETRAGAWGGAGDAGDVRSVTTPRGRWGEYHSSRTSSHKWHPRDTLGSDTARVGLFFFL